MTPTYENRTRYEDRSVLSRVHASRDAAVRDVAQMIEDGDEDEYDGTLVVHRDRYGRVERVEIVDLIPLAEDWIREAHEAPVHSIHHQHSWRAYG
ncbi:MAG: hypothetical protein IPK85_02335 [Gemmatimonadetes bacterium]|nr:hypothetical protein [Gemmatimonadota bacterium]